MSKNKKNQYTVEKFEKKIVKVQVDINEFEDKEMNGYYCKKGNDIVFTVINGGYENQSLPAFYVYFEDVVSGQLLFSTLDESKIENYIDEHGEVIEWFISKNIRLFKSDFAIMSIQYENVIVTKSVDIFAKYVGGMMSNGEENHKDAYEFLKKYAEENLLK